MGGTSRVVITAKALGGKICSIIGWIYAVILVLAVIGLVAEGIFDIYTFIALILFTAPAVALIVIGIRIKQRIQRFRNYVAVLSTKGGSAHVEELAMAVTKPPIFVAREVNSMINQRYFANATINPATGVVAINSQFDANAYTQPVMGMPVASMTMPTAPAQLPVIESFTCKGCSAVGSKQKGFHGECDYCGTIAS